MGKASSAVSSPRVAVKVFFCLLILFGLGLWFNAFETQILYDQLSSWQDTASSTSSKRIQNGSETTGAPSVSVTDSKPIVNGKESPRPSIETKTKPASAANDSRALELKSKLKELQARYEARKVESESKIVALKKKLEEKRQKLQDLRKEVSDMREQKQSDCRKGSKASSVDNGEMNLLAKLDSYIQKTAQNVTTSGSGYTYTSSDIEALRTKVHCYTQGDFSQTCVYDNLCYDGANMLVLVGDDSDHTHMEAFPKYFAAADGGNSEMVPRPPQEDGVNPRNSRLQYAYAKASELFGKDASVPVKWVTGPLYFMERDTNEANMWHWLIKMTFMHDWHQYNHTWNLPDMKYFLMTRKSTLIQWEQNVMEALTPTESSVKEILRYPFTQEFSRLCVEDKAILCGRKMVVPGTKFHFFNGYADAHAFKDRMFYKFGIPQTDLIDPVIQLRKPPNKLLIYGRIHRSRKYENIDDMVKLVESYNIPYEVYNPTGSNPFEEQIGKMASAGVLVIVHGAGCSNVAFMPHGAAVIEVHTYLLTKKMYSTISWHSGLWHFPILSRIKGHSEPGNGLDIRSEEFIQDCDFESSHRNNYRNLCHQPSKHADTIVPLDALETALVNAFDVIGHPLTKSA